MSMISSVQSHCHEGSPLSVSAGNGWPHNALRHHWLMPIICHFWDCKVLLVASLTHVSSARTSVQTFTFYTFTIQHRTVLIIFRLILQTITTAQTLSTGGTADSNKQRWAKYSLLSIWNTKYWSFSISNTKIPNTFLWVFEIQNTK